ncbi:hypothetical protein [Ferrovibrio sp.]|uniref:hypothetical protein n=1 Tax=Ferrovibrio sp. TaxID=1917215 RepID=UPI003D1404CD
MSLIDRAFLEMVLSEYVKLDPRDGKSGAFAQLNDDVDVDLWAEDSYLVGLVLSFLKGNLPNDNCIKLNRSIDHRLSKYLDNAPPEIAMQVMAFRNYRIKMRQLANALSKASGLQIVDA